MRCKRCGAGLDLTMERCPACGAEVELGRLTGILGLVCRACDAYNEPGATACVACGKPLGATGEVPVVADATPPQATPAVASAAAKPAAEATAVRGFQRGGAGATRFVPSAALRPAASPPAGSPPVAPGRCPRCGAGAGGAAFCSRCGQPLGAAGTQLVAVAAAPAPPPRAGVAPGQARLVLERGDGAAGATFLLADPSCEAGRRPGGVAFPQDPCLAPHHATFFYRSGALHVRDEGAPGGVFLRVRGPSVPLRPGDELAVGDRRLRYAGPLPAPPPAPPDGTRRLGAPRPAGVAIVLEERLEGGAAGRVFVRGGPSVTVGRAGCAVNLGEDPLLAQAHAELLVEQGGAAKLRDLGSPDGTFVRLPRHAERELRDGDTLRIGREVLRVAFTG